jgi:hypothetical protein
MPSRTGAGSLGMPTVRQISPGDPDFEVLHRRRNDAESINPHPDDGRVSASPTAPRQP